MNAPSQSFLGRYRLVKVLGQGAMGVVYEAVDTRLGRTVAIKTVLRSHMADEVMAKEYATRFEREAQAAARLSHPNVVAVYDFGEHEDISYIVMEFVRGRELNQAFEAGETFSLAEVVRLMCELLQALDYAHQHGIVHRDVKPANVLIDGAGRVKLTDFGVARVANANSDRTMPGTLVGTPSYMSPEQILGMAVGSRTDIFAAGVVLYQFLTGKRPFTGGGPFGVQRKIVQDDPVPPSQIRADIPPGFDAIVARSLAKKPEHRYESAGAFAADLEQVAAALPRPSMLLDLDFSDTTTPAPTAPLPTAPVAATAPAPAGVPSPSPPAAAASPSFPPAPAPAPWARAPASATRPVAPPAAPAAVDPAAPTEITPLPFAASGGTDLGSRVDSRPPTFAESTPPPFDPEATVIMVRPPLPSGAARGGTPTGTVATPAATSVPSPATTARAQPGPPAAPSAAPSTPQQQPPAPPRAPAPAGAPPASQWASPPHAVPPAHAPSPLATSASPRLAPGPAAAPPGRPPGPRGEPMPPAPPEPVAPPPVVAARSSAAASPMTRPIAPASGPAQSRPAAAPFSPPVAAPPSRAGETASTARPLAPDITLLAPSPQPRAAPTPPPAAGSTRSIPLPAPASARPKDGSPLLRALLPLLLGAGIAAVVFGIWLALSRPASTAASSYPSDSTAATGDARPAAAVTSPSLSSPAEPSASAASASGGSTLADAPTKPVEPPAAPATRSTAAESTTTAPSTGAAAETTRTAARKPPAATRPAAPRPSPPAATPTGSRRETAGSTDRPSPATPAPSRSTEARCSDLLQRMQLGEPLMPEQTQFFQTRCTR